LINPLVLAYTIERRGDKDSLGKGTKIDNFNMRHNHLKLIVSLFLTIITLATFWQVQNHEFVIYDDYEYITGNSHAQAGLTFDGIVWAFTTTHVSNWHPLTWLSHMLDCHLYGLNPKGHHFNNVLLHIASTLLLFLVLERMTGALWRSSFVAALFALHPLHVESVAWVASRKDVLSTFFWMLTVLAYVRYVEQPGLNRYLLVLLFFALGLMSKPMLVTLPFVLLLLDYWPLGRFQFGQSVGDSNPKTQEAVNLRYHRWIGLHLIWEKVPFFVFAAVSSLVTLQSQLGSTASFEVLPLRFRIANALVSYASYIGKMLWPHHLTVLYPHPIDTLPMWQVVGACILLMCISFLVIRQAQQRPYLVVGWLWYLGTLVPVIGLVQVGVQAMADRYTYVPLIGLFMLIVWAGPDLMAKWRHLRIALTVSAGILLSALMISSWIQVQYWKNSIMLFNHALDVTSHNYIAHFHLGNALTQQGKLKLAITHYSEALRIKPDYAHAHNNLGNALAEQGKLNLAITHYSEALRIKPDYAHAHYDLGNALAEQGKLNLAITHYSEALRINPDFMEAQHNLKVTLHRMGKHKEVSKPINSP